MAWVCVDEDKSEAIFELKPIRSPYSNFWIVLKDSNFIDLPSGTIKKLIGRDLSFDDEPVELT